MKFISKYMAGCLLLTCSLANGQGFSTPYHERFPTSSTEKIKVLYVRYEGREGINNGQGFWKEALEVNHKLCETYLQATGKKAQTLDLDVAEKYSDTFKEEYTSGNGWRLIHSGYAKATINMEDCSLRTYRIAKATIVGPRGTAYCTYNTHSEGDIKEARMPANVATGACSSAQPTATSYVAVSPEMRAKLNPSNQLEKCVSDIPPGLRGSVCHDLRYPTMYAVNKTGTVEMQYPVYTRYEIFHLHGPFALMKSTVKHEEMMVGKDFFNVPPSFRISGSGKNDVTEYE